MKASDIMTTEVVTVGPNAPVTEIAGILVKHGISGVPVVDSERRLLGMVSEGDLMRRAELGTERRHSWWLRAFADNATLAAEYAKAHARTARNIMTGEVATVSPSTPIADIANLLEERRIKRVPVVDNGKLVGIVSRANLVRALVTAERVAEPTDSDSKIKDMVAAELKAQPWATLGKSHVVVRKGIVHLWGLVQSEEERRAARVAAENIPGVRMVRDHLSIERHYAPL